jgi:hypothetical protein
MKIKDLVMNIPIWRNGEERCLLDSITGPTMLSTLEEREKTVAENLIRKNLLIKVIKDDIVYVCRSI